MWADNSISFGGLKKLTPPIGEYSQSSSVFLRKETALSYIPKRCKLFICACRHSQRENEVRKLTAVSQDGLTLTLNEPLKYTHLGVSVTLPDGTVFEARAEVGLLTRNIVVRGSQNQEWNDDIEACPDGFNTGTAFDW